MTHESSPADRPREPQSPAPVPNDTSDVQRPPDPLLHIIIGSPDAVNLCRLELHRCGYAAAGSWSAPMKMVNTANLLRAQNPNDVMRVLSKRVTPPSA